jgi:hypothetical protein
MTSLQPCALPDGSRCSSRVGPTRRLATAQVATNVSSDKKPRQHCFKSVESQAAVHTRTDSLPVDSCKLLTHWENSPSDRILVSTLGSASVSVHVVSFVDPHCPDGRGQHARVDAERVASPSGNRTWRAQFFIYSIPGMTLNDRVAPVQRVTAAPGRSGRRKASLLQAMNVRSAIRHTVAH